MNGPGRCTLRLYVRPGCHLCEDMWFDLQELSGTLKFELEAVDITGSPRLEAVYGTRIPVLEADGRELCNYYLDRQALFNHLDRRGGAAI